MYSLQSTDGVLDIRLFPAVHSAELLIAITIRTSRRERISCMMLFVPHRETEYSVHVG